MRTSAEQDRVAQFKSVTISQSRRYYAVLDSFARMLDLKQSTGTIHDTFQSIARQKEQEAQLLAALDYLVEFTRQVIESGLCFGPQHLFILLLQLDPQQLTPELGEYLRVVLREFALDGEAVRRWLETDVKEEQLREAIGAMNLF